MRYKIRQIGLAMLLTSLAAWADIPSDAGKKQQLVEQKSKLVEALVNTPAMRNAAAGKNPEVAGLILKSRTLLDLAKADIGKAQPEQALDNLDEALRTLSKASSLLTSDGHASEANQRRQFQETSNQVDSYRRALEEMAGSGQAAVQAKQSLTRLDALTSEGRKLFDSGKLGDANKRLADAYKLAVEDIARLRDGQEVVLRLHFNSPREEFVYEQKRYHSNEILVGMLVREDRFSGESRTQVDAYAKAALDHKESATEKATGNDYAAAVKEMEKANLQLNRALQLMGVPVF